MAHGNSRRPKLIRENVGGESYEYFPLGRFVVSCPEVCRGRPTFKYTRVEVEGVLRMLAHGWTVERIVSGYNRPEITAEALAEAGEIAGKVLIQHSRGLGKTA